MGNRFESLFTGNYEADFSIKEKDDHNFSTFGYEELHLSDELIDAIKSGKAIDVDVQDEYTLRILYGSKEDKNDRDN